MNLWGATDRGLVRQANQDSLYFEAFSGGEQAILVVCDGMGGARAGNVASGLAVSSFASEAQQTLKPDITRKNIISLADRSVTLANTAVYEKSRSSEDYLGMGTTLVGAIVYGMFAVIANVGDSRAYFISENGILRITRDHSVVEDMLDRGDLTAEEARVHPSRNLITRALGTEPEVRCDIYTEDFELGTFLLLCTDGLTNVVEDQEILYEVLYGGDLDDCAHRLIGIANSRGGPDNITAVLLAF